jgi:tape measure domain-containing protein
MKIYEYVIRIKDQATDKLRKLAQGGSSVSNVFRNAANSAKAFAGSIGSTLATGLRSATNTLKSFGSQLVSSLTGFSLGAGPIVMAAALAAALGFAGAKALSLAADLEQTTVGFEVMLGSAQKANKMITDLRQFAKVTPFETTDLIRSTEILLGFGIAGEKIMPTLNMLGDVARGNSEKLKLISLAYAQIQAAGRLMGQDLLQLVNAGFNPLQEISRKTGKSLKQLKAEMENGNISAAMVTDAFRSATSEGGRFFGMMERQSKTYSGTLSTLKDEFTEALTSLGEKLLPSAIKAVNWLRNALSDLVNRVDYSPLLSAFRDLWNSFKEIGGLFVGLFMEVFKAMGITVTQAGVFQAAFSSIALVLRTLFLPMRLVITLFTTLITTIGTAVTAVKGFFTVLDNLKSGNFALAKVNFDETRKSVGEGLSDIKKKLVDFGKSEYEGYKEIFTTGLKDESKTPMSAFDAMGKDANAQNNEDAKDGLDKITGGGRQHVNVTINLENLIGTQNFEVTNVKETVNDIKKMTVEALLQVLNSANYAASQ